MSDTDVLAPGTIVSFTVHGSPCGQIYEQDIRNGLNNWTSQMMSIVSLTTTPEGYVPTIVNVNVTATVINAIPAGDLRGQIMAALNAMSNVGVTPCTLGLQDNVLNYAAGGTDPAAPASSSSSTVSTSVLIAAAALLGVVILTRR